jgi:hypothetical protein
MELMRQGAHLRGEILEPRLQGTHLRGNFSGL